MALGTREILLVIRARDEASRSLRFLSGNLRQVDRQAAAAASGMLAWGTALFSVGVAFTSVGAAILNGMNDATVAAAGYDRLARMTMTQVDGVKVSLEELKDAAIDVGRKVPVPLEDLQNTLYDIYSTIDVNHPQAIKLLEAFAKTAVTGQSDIRRSAMTTIAILNAFQMPIESITRLQDVQFQAVRKGAMTYEELASNIGKAIPAAVTAGQAFEDLAGMMSFLTRGGLSASMASTSAARALEALAHPTTVKRMEKLGISVRQANGEFRPMIDIFGQLYKKTKNLASPERNKLIQDLLKGAGNQIQARRFWTRALKDFDELKKHRDWMANSQGVFQEAYQTMFEAPQSQLELLRNKYEAMRIEIGEKLIPAKLALAEAITKVLDVWTRLTPKQQEIIVKVIALTGLLSVLIGIVAMVAGVWLMLSAAATIVGVSLGTVAAVIAGVVAAIAGLAVVGYLVWRNWDTLKAHTKAIWAGIKEAVQDVVDWFRNEVVPVFTGLAKGIISAWNTIKRSLSVVWDSIVAGAKGFWGSIKAAWARGAEKLKPALDRIRGAWDYIKERWDYIKPGLIRFFTAIGNKIENFAKNVAPLLEDAGDLFGGFLDILGRAVGPLLEGVIDFLGKLGTQAAIAAKGLTALLTGDWETLGQQFLAGWTNIKDGLLGILTSIKDSVSSGLDGIWELFKEKMFAPISVEPNQYEILVDNIVTAISTLPDRAGVYFDDLGKRFGIALATLPARVTVLIEETATNLEIGLKILAAKAATALDRLPDQIAEFFRGLPDKIINFLKELPGRIKGIFISSKTEAGGAVDEMSTTLARKFAIMVGNIIWALITLPVKLRLAALNGMLHFLAGVVQMIPTILVQFGALAARIINAVRSLPLIMFSIGMNIVGSLASGIANGASSVVRAISGVVGSAISAAKNRLGIRSPSKVFKEMGERTMEGFAQGIQGSVDQVKRAYAVFNLRIEEQRKKVREWYRADKISAKTASIWMARLDQAESMGDRRKGELLKLAKVQEARQALKDLRQEAWEFAHDVRVLVNEVGSLKNNMPTGDDVWAPATFNDLQTNLEKSLATAKDFRDKINALQRSGLNSATLREIIEMGPEEGARAAALILSGGVKGIQELNKLQAEIDAVAKGTAMDAKDAMYGAGIAAAQGLIDGLNVKTKDVEEAISRIADAMVRAIEVKLGIASPSKVFMRIGFDLTQGLSTGLDRARFEAVRAAERTSRAVILAMDKDYNMGSVSTARPSIPSYGMTAIQGVIGREVSRPPAVVNVYTQEIDPILHAQQLGDELTRRGL